MQRGIEKYLVQGNTEDVTPVFQSTKGYGVFWDNYAGTMYVDNKEISDADFAPAQIWEFVKGENQDWVAEEVEKEKKAPAKRAAKASK